MYFYTRISVQVSAKPSSLAALPMRGRLALHNRRNSSGFTLLEVVISATIVVLVFGGIIEAYVQSGQRLEWTGYSLAAQALAMQTIEQARATVWDPAQTPPVNELTNLNLMGYSYNSSSLTLTGYSTNILDVPYESTNYVMATNFVTIQIVNINGNSNLQEQVVQVQTVWPFVIRASNLYFTNTATTIISPDNRAPQTF
jgi:type II secretory pathway component PulJ